MGAVTQEDLLERKALYERELQEIARLAEIYKGALQDVEHWLCVVEEPVEDDATQ